MDAADHLIVALDFPTAPEALQLVERLDGQVRWVKVGLELYLAEGRSMVNALVARGLHVFLDLKLHDIPNTVAAAVRVAGASGADLLTVHAGSGPAMLASAAQAAPPSLRLLAVTVLTSMGQADLQAVGVSDTAEEQVGRLATLAVGAGVTGLVCSPAELVSVRRSVGPETLLVTPGIRSAAAPADDQQRTASAYDAVRSGADMLVVGRPITRAGDPAAATAALLREIDSALHQRA